MCINLRLPVADKNRKQFTRPAWDKVSPEDRELMYAHPLDIAVQNILMNFGLDPNDIMNSVFDQTISALDLNRFVQCLSEQMRNAGYNLPMSKFNKSAKPFWSESLQTLKKSSLEAKREWDNAGKPRAANNELHRKYKAAKKYFQKAYDQAEFEFEAQGIYELANRGEMDQKFFWWYYSRLKKQPKGVSPIKDDSGNLITDVDLIRNEWNVYYEKLFDDNYVYKGDPDFYNAILLELENIRHMDSGTPFLKGGVITYEEVCKIISALKNMKAPGWDEISNEHLKYAGKLTKAVITWMLNKIVETEVIPVNLKRGYIISLPKPQKDSTKKTNNRGITLLSVFYKLFERITLNREKQWLFNTESMSELQGAGREEISCLHTSLLVQESIAYNLKLHGKAFATFTDIMKAFDCVWLAGLLVKLYRNNIDLKTWKLIDNAYCDFQCSALVNGVPGTWFKVKRGVHQGAPLSMPLYQIFINDLLIELHESRIGTTINGINTTSPTHADDLALITYYKSAMNDLLKIAFTHSVKWFYSFSVDKCITMSFGNVSKGEQQIPIRLGHDTIKHKSDSKHMGITLTSDPKLELETYMKRANDLKSVTYAARSLSICRFLLFRQ